MHILKIALITWHIPFNLYTDIEQCSLLPSRSRRTIFRDCQHSTQTLSLTTAMQQHLDNATKAVCHYLQRFPLSLFGTVTSSATVSVNTTMMKSLWKLWIYQKVYYCRLWIMQQSSALLFIHVFRLCRNKLGFSPDLFGVVLHHSIL